MSPPARRLPIRDASGAVLYVIHDSTLTADAESVSESLTALTKTLGDMLGVAEFQALISAIGFVADNVKHAYDAARSQYGVAPKRMTVTANPVTVLGKRLALALPKPEEYGSVGVLCGMILGSTFLMRGRLPEMRGSRKMEVRAVGLILSVFVLAACGGSNNPDRSSAIGQDIMTNGSQQMQAYISSVSPGSSISMDDANCVQTAGTEQYSCIAHYAVTDSSGNTLRYEVNIDATCDSSGTCAWHTDGGGNLVSSTPAQPAEGSPCTPSGGGSGVIVIEGPTAANPGQAECVPQAG